MVVIPRNSNSFSSVTRVCFLQSGSQSESLHLQGNSSFEIRCFYLGIRILRIRKFFYLILITITGYSNFYFSATGLISSLKGSIDNVILPEEELDKTLRFLILASIFRCSVNSRMCYQFWFFSKLNLTLVLGYWLDSFLEALFRRV